MTSRLTGQVIINGHDLWTDYHAFLRDERPGGRENLAALLKPAGMKPQVAVSLREENGERHSTSLGQKSEGRDVTLHIAIHAATVAEFVGRYRNLLAFLKTGANGWLDFSFPTLGLAMHMYCKEFPDNFKPISDLWNAGEQCGAIRVTFREPVSSF